MSVIDKLNNIINCKNAIKAAINNKGGTLTESSKLRDYATAIDNLTGGGGENCGGLIEVNSLPDNKYDTTSIYTTPHKVNDILINVQIKEAGNETILFSQFSSASLKAPLIGGEVVDSLPTENIIETTQTSGFYFYYSTSNNEAYLHSTEIFGG